MNLDRTRQPDIHELTSINILSPRKETFPNGIPVNIINAGSQEVVRLDFVFAGGRWQQSQKLQALFTNRMLREGTNCYSSSDVAEKLDFYGAWLELSCSLEYSYITLYSLNKYFSETLDVLESIIKQPAFPEKELNMVVDTNIQQYQVNAGKVDFQAQRSFLTSIFGEKHPCGQHADEADFKKINPSLLREFHNKFYHSGNCAIFLAGKVTDKVLQKVESVFGAEKFGSTAAVCPSKKEYPVITVPEKRIFTEVPGSMQSAVKLGNITISRHHPDYYKVRVLMTLFGGYFGSRLMTNIREEKGYTYGIFAGLYFHSDTGVMLISTETANEYVEPLIGEVYHEMEKLRNQPVSEEELSTVKNYMTGELCRNYESPFSLSDAWIFVYTSDFSTDCFSEYLHTIRKITSQDIQQLACKYLSADSLKEVVAGTKIL